MRVSVHRDHSDRRIVITRRVGHPTPRGWPADSGAVGTTVLRARAAGLDWPQVQAGADEALEARRYGRPEAAGTRQPPQPDCASLHAERRKPGVTLQLLHLEDLEQHPTGYRYTRFCDLYRRWLQRRGLSMRQVHRAGEKCFGDEQCFSLVARDDPARGSSGA